METLFLDIVNGISDSRFWLGPLVFFLCFCDSDFGNI